MVTRVRGRVNDVVRGAANKAADIARSVVPGVTVGAAISHETFMRFAANLNWATRESNPRPQAIRPVLYMLIPPLFLL